MMKTLRDLLAGKEYFVVTSNADTHFQINGFDPNRIFEMEGNFDGLREGDLIWQNQQKKFDAFMQENALRKLLVLELGIGAHNQVIKAPIMQMIAEHPAWQYITMNLPQEINVLPQIKDRSLSVPGNIADSLEHISELLKFQQNEGRL